MGPTQSSAAWGFAEERQGHQESPSATRDASQPSTPTHSHPPPPDRLAFQPHDTDPDPHDSHRVSIHPVYELALCRKIKETLGKGETREAARSPVDRGQAAPAAEDTGRPGSVVRAQPERGASHRESAVSTEFGQSGLGHSAARHLLGDSAGQVTGQLVGQLTGQLNREPLSEHGREWRSQGDPGTLEEASPQERGVAEQSPQPQQADSGEEAASPYQPHTALGHHPGTVTPPHHTTTPTTPATPTTTTTPTTPVQTESRSSQTSPPDLPPALCPPPVRPMVLSVSTPPDETSPMFRKLSPLGTGHLTDDTPSSPDLESDASDAGSVAWTGRLAQDGASADGAAAAGASEAMSDAGRRKTRSKKKEKSADYVLRTLNNLSSTEDKLTALCKKYTDLYEEQRAMQVLLKQHQRKMGVMQREKDQLQTELNRAVMAKGKLESLCRELQKQNKVIKEDSLARLKEEEDRRKQMSAKFKTSLAGIQEQVEENHRQNLRLREENGGLRQRLDAFLEQHQVHGDQLEQMSLRRRQDLELAEARLQHAATLLALEQDRHLKEKEMMLLQTAEGEKKNEILEAELSKYRERYEGFQDSLSTSSHVFHTLSADMDKMGRGMKRLEREGLQWKAKWEDSQTALQQVTQQKRQCEDAGRRAEDRAGRLESLCRALQAQRCLPAPDPDDASTEDVTPPGPMVPIADCSGTDTDTNPEVVPHHWATGTHHPDDASPS